MSDHDRIGYIITGHTGGIGKELAAHALRGGHKVVGIARSNLKDQKQSYAQINFSEVQCDFSRLEGNMLSREQLGVIDEALIDCSKIVYILNAGQNHSPDYAAVEMLDTVVKLLTVNAIAQLKLLGELLTHRTNMVDKCIFIGSYLTFLNSSHTSIGYVLSKNILQELTLRYQEQTNSSLRLQTIVLGGVYTSMNRQEQIDKNSIRSWLGKLFRLSPEQAARSIIKASELNSPIKFIPALPALPVSVLYYGRVFLRSLFYLFRR
jgi:short-subunit dehydrogenase